jgi:hypothetical protein
MGGGKYDALPARGIYGNSFTVCRYIRENNSAISVPSCIDFNKATRNGGFVDRLKSETLIKTLIKG